MVTEQLIVKSGYKQTEVGIIPDDWDVEYVRDSFDICNNLRFPISGTIRNKMVGPYPYYGPTGIQSYINEYRVDGEYALIGEDGDHFLKWRNQSMTLLVKGKFNVNNHAHLLKGSKNLTEWFYWYFSNRDIKQHLTKQGAGRLKLTKKALEMILCAIPSYLEQEKICHILSNIDKLIVNFGKLIEKKKNTKKGAMQELLTGKRRLEGYNEEWNIEKLGNILNYEQPTKYLVKDTKYNNNYNIPVLTAGQTFVLGFTNEKMGIFKNIPVIIFDDFTTASKYVDFSFKVKSSAMKILKPKNEKINLKFIYERIQLINFPLGNHKRYWISEYQKLEIGLPKHDEQNSIAKILSNMDTEIKELETKKEKYIMIKKGMMQKLLTGEIRLQ